ncbi:GGDEF domain-containing protein [Paraburkholderia diazotrophica]|uniref:diguanylate cyclase n=1 Tax=Paraburkholderia diazotrophica TaxID=667676 RepID=A0A1H6Y4J5_9BURK|nr:GGDEF domain-containing protein [Paraburkholderia diazotrophica]SEJ32102.1 diguanylate cyclase (GGDEF) domain-containing protein [Paraburkholderia diazotrophica]
MHVDLITLYLLAIGTLLASCGMTLWERRTHPGRSRELQILAAGYATLAIGCAVAPLRHDLPGAAGSALSNLIIVSGYLLILHGVASLSNRQYRAGSIGMLVLLALAWAVGGTRWQETMWSYVSAFPIAVACGMTSRELLRCDGMKGMQSRHIAAIVSGAHAFFYAARAFVLPGLVALYGQGMLLVVGKITIYEGVLYSVVLPMTLLRLVRDEAHGQLLKESQTDYLTGLGNRRWFFEEGARVIRGEVSRPVSLLAFDLDQFKAINDRYGHETGDEVLKSFGDVARGVLGRDAILARIGGEEFAALLPRHDSVRSKEVGEAIVRRFADAVSHRKNGVEIRGTVSIGLAQSTSETLTLADLLAAADQALYSAKSLGGNRVELAQPAARLGSRDDDDEVASRRRSTV